MCHTVVINGDAIVTVPRIFGTPVKKIDSGASADGRNALNKR